MLGALFKAKKTKVTLIGLGVLGTIFLAIWGSMKYDSYRIRTLQQALDQQRLEFESVIRAQRMTQITQTIDSEVLRSFLEEQAALTRQNETLQSQIEVSVRELRREYERNAGNEDHSTEHTPDIDTVIATRIIDGMYESYCNTVRDSSRCPQR